MTALVVYDSTYGNTKALAMAMASALGDARSVAAGDVIASDLVEPELLVVGSPTQGGRPAAAVTQFLENIPAGGLNRTRVAAFDTRFASSRHGFGLRVLMKAIGFAAPRIASVLRAKGGRLVALPEGFVVEEKEGPLREGELDRAAEWARSLVAGRPSP